MIDKDRIYFNNLYDYYSELLTEISKENFESYYFNNLSLAEIAKNRGVSRNAVHKSIKVIEEKLKEYESKLKLYERSKKIDEYLEETKDEKTKEMLESLR